MSLATSVAFRSLSSTGSERFLAVAGQSIRVTLPLQRKPHFCPFLVASRGRNLCSAIAASSSSSSKKKNKKKLSRNHVSMGNEEEEEEEEEEDAFELLFKQLEEDLKNDDSSKDDSNDEISEEDLALLERELEDALGEYDTEVLNPVVNDIETGNDPEDDNDDGDERLLKLRNWQMKKLARALKAGRRKTSIKNLAAELCLDRALVLELLRDPPPNLLMMSLSIPDEPTATVIPIETKPRETVHNETSMGRVESGPKAKVPVHAMQRSWSAQKRLKKAQVDTLERVYRRSKRPTDAMISSIVHVTNIPRKRVVKWFEDKRAEEGVPNRRVPYQRTVPETA